MAPPPPKRRKLSTSRTEDGIRLDNSTVYPDASPSFPHAVESLRHNSPFAPARTGAVSNKLLTSPTRLPMVEGIQDFKVLVPRQGTDASSTASSTSALEILSAAVASVTSQLPATEILSDALTALASVASSPTAPADTVPAGVTLTSSSSSSISSSLSASSSTASQTSSTGSKSSSNDTSSTSTQSSSSSSIAASSTGRPAFPGNFTTSAIIIEGESSTYTSRTTIDLATASHDGAFFFATLNNGDVSTISRHSGAFTTTLRNGEVFTVPSMSASSTRSGSRVTEHSTMTETASMDSSSHGRSTITAVATVGAGTNQGQGSPVSSAATTTAGASSNSNDNDSTPPAGVIAGGVVGGAAGLAVLLLIAMVFVRWYRRRNQFGHEPLPPASVTSPDTEHFSDRSPPGMAERAGLMPFMGAVPALFRHQNRSVDDSAPSERGFTRVSGRKLPSAFSEGMSSEGMADAGRGNYRPPPGMPLSSSPPRDQERSRSGNPFYRDSNGYYRGEGGTDTSPSDSIPNRNSAHELMTMSPGPQRQPQLHEGGPYVMSPTTSDAPSSPPGTVAAFSRSDTPSSLRNSRFTEDM